MKTNLMVLVLTISTLLLITGSAIALPVVLKPIPTTPEPVIMLLFGSSLIGISVVGRRLQRELKTIRA